MKSNRKDAQAKPESVLNPCIGIWHVPTAMVEVETPLKPAKLFFIWSIGSDDIPVENPHGSLVCAASR
jgi:hypothetical protein